MTSAGTAVVEVGVAVVRCALQLTVGFVGDPTLGVSDAMIDVAAVDGHVAARGVPAVAVTDLHRPAQPAAERAHRRRRDDPVGTVEDERLHL